MTLNLVGQEDLASKNDNRAGRQKAILKMCIVDTVGSGREIAQPSPRAHVPGMCLDAEDENHFESKNHVCNNGFPDKMGNKVFS